MQLKQTPVQPQISAPAPKPKQEAFRTMTAQDYKTFAATLSQDPVIPVAKPVAQAFKPVEKVPPKPVEAPKPIPQAPKPAVQEAPKQPEPVQEELSVKKNAPYRIVGEVLNTYIIIEQEENVLFLDKHAAHERILFERLKQTDEPVMAQSLIAPVTAALTQEEAAAVLEHRELLLRYGFEAEDFGSHVLLRQIPADLDLSHAEDALQELAQRLMLGRDTKSMRDDLLHTIACKAAIKAGWHTTEKERDALVKEVMDRADIKYCPHGRPIITTLTKTQLERQFKRS